jgi:predicted component of type VI protein secretion system
MGPESMKPLRTFETTLTSLVEGAFGRLFRSEVRPMELARKLAREMDEHRTASVSRVYAPNEYAVWLSAEDRARYEGVEADLIEELCAYLLEHARSEDLTLASHPVITFHTDPELSLGEFGIQARLVRPEDPGHPEAGGEDSASADVGWAEPGRVDWDAPDSPAPSGAARRSPAQAAAPPPPPEAEHGNTMIYSRSRRLREPLERGPARAPARAMLLLDGRSLLVAPAGAVIGRSRDCDVVLDDAGVSRRHAYIRPSDGGWTIEDLRSTNGVLLNNVPLRGVQRLREGDRIALGTTEIVFELR